MKYVREGLSTFVLLGCTFLSLTYGVGYFGYTGCALIYAFIFAFFYAIFNNKKRVYLNPILPFFDLLNKKIKAKNFWGYILAEAIASLVAAGFVFLLVLTTAKGSSIIQNARWVSGIGNLSETSTNIPAALIFETILAGVFTVVFFCTYKKCSSTKLRAVLLGLTVGLFLLCSFCITSTGANPAKAFGPAVVYTCVGEIALFLQFLILCFSDFIGTLIAFFVLKKCKLLNDKES